MSMEDYKYKRQAIRAAKDLGYKEETIDKLKETKNSGEILRIMREARCSM